MTVFNNPQPPLPGDAASARLLLLHPDDTVLVCASPIMPGDVFNVGPVQVRAASTIGMGHKIARFPLKMGDKVIKYGVSIGSLVAAVEVGEHVHLHNMQSDYIPSHTRQGLNRSQPR